MIPCSLDRTPYGARDFYLGNDNVRRAGARQTQWTHELMAEYKRCKNDIAYFCSTYVKVLNLDRGMVSFDPYPYQEKMWDLCQDNRFTVILAARQSGKTIGIIGYLLHYAIFNQAKQIAVVAHKGDQAREILSRFATALENLPMFLQPGCRTFNKGRIHFDTNTTIFSSSSTSGSLRGKSVNLLYLDEFAFVEHDAKFMTATYPIITSGKTSRVIITSTANGVGNQFHKIYSQSVEGKNDYKNMRVDWSDVPGRDEEWKRETIANTSEEQFKQEFCLGGESKVKILIDNREMVVKLKDLANVISNPRRVLVDQNVRFDAICWSDNRRQTSCSNEFASSVATLSWNDVHDGNFAQIRMSQENPSLGSNRSRNKKNSTSKWSKFDEIGNGLWSRLGKFHDTGISLQRSIAIEDEGICDTQSEIRSFTAKRAVQRELEKSTIPRQPDVEEKELVRKGFQENNKSTIDRVDGRVQVDELGTDSIQEWKNETTRENGISNARSKIWRESSDNFQHFERQENFAGALIWTHAGWKSFRGVQSRSVSKVRVIRLTNGTEIVSSINHPYVDFTSAKIETDHVDARSEILFDPIGVDGGLYTHDGFIISHNCNEFIGSSDTLINPNALLAMSERRPVWEGDDGVRVYERPHKRDPDDRKTRDAVYVMSVDVCKGRGKDRSTFNVFDVSASPFRQVACYQNAEISPMFLPDVIVKWAKLYNDALLVIESNDEGASVARSCLYEHEYDNVYCESWKNPNGVGVMVTKLVKRLGCSRLKDMIEGNTLTIVDAQTIGELMTFVRVKDSWGASPGNHDDLVANLWMLSWLVATDLFKDLTAGVDLKQKLFAEKERALSDSIPFAGHFGDTSDYATDYLIERGYLNSRPEDGGFSAL